MAEVTLSFDNGPTPGVTERVLDVLADRGLAATFFVVGERLARPGARACSERAHADGHWIGNHTLSHSGPFGDLDPAQRRREIDATQTLLGDLAHPDKLFRPVGGGGAIEPGLLTREALQALVDGGYTCVTWNAVPGDFEDPDGWVDVALEQCGAQEETLLVLHDIASGAMDHLETFLDRAAAAGLTFRQPFPEDCVLLRRGAVTQPLEGLLSP